MEQEEADEMRRKRTRSEAIPFVVPMEGREYEFHNFPFVAIGNQVDREKRIVHQNDALAWTQGKGGIPFFECSAKDSLDVNKAFECVARNAVEHKDDLAEKHGEKGQSE